MNITRKTSEYREDSLNLRMEVTPAAWGGTWSRARHLNHQPSQYERSHQTCHGVVGGKHRWLYRNPHGNDTSLGSKKVPTTPSLQHDDRILTWNAHRLRQRCWRSQHVLAAKSTLGTYSCSLGESVIVTDLGNFFSQLTACEHLIKGCELHLAILQILWCDA